MVAQGHLSRVDESIRRIDAEEALNVARDKASSNYDVELRGFLSRHQEEPMFVPCAEHQLFYTRRGTFRSENVSTEQTMLQIVQGVL